MTAGGEGGGDMPGGAGDDDAWVEVARQLQPLFGDAAFELRFSLRGAAAVRVLAPAGPVAALHAAPRDPAAPWIARGDCADAAGWLLATRAPEDEARARELLQRAVDRHTALAIQRLSGRRAAMATAVIERLTHRLRTDVSALQAVTEGALRGLFRPEELDTVGDEVAATAAEAQRQLSDAREVMSTLHPTAARDPEPLLGVLRGELEAGGTEVAVTGPEGEDPMALLPGAGWGVCARLLAGALAADPRLGGDAATVAVEPDPDGWTLVAGAPGPAGEALAWTQRTVGALLHAGHVAVAAGGAATAARVGDDGLRVTITVPAAPSGSTAAAPGAG
jgi:hypothetical protein